MNGRMSVCLKDIPGHMICHIKHHVGVPPSAELTLSLPIEFSSKMRAAGTHKKATPIAADNLITQGILG